MNVLIMGNTFPVKDQLRAMGGKWDAAQKGWLVPEAKGKLRAKIVALTAAEKSRAAGGSGENPGEAA